MAHFFAALLALVQAATPTPPAPLSLDARWVVTFDSTPAAPPGFDANTAYIPLKGGSLVAVTLDRGSIRWRLDVTTPFTPATGEGLVFIVARSEEHTSELQSLAYLVCRLLLEKKKNEHSTTLPC